MKSDKKYGQAEYEDERRRRLRQLIFRVVGFFRREYPAIVLGSLFTASLVFAVLSFRSRRGREVFHLSDSRVLGRQSGLSDETSAKSGSVSAVGASSAATLATTPTQIKSSRSQLSVININTALAEELNRLPGISLQVAGNIVRYRQANGPFRNTRDLMKVSGIKEKRFAQIESLVTVGP